MSGIAIVTDSNSGITQKEAKDLGIFVVPMPFMINGETFYEDINLTQDEFYEYLAQGADVATSQPSPEDVLNIWDEALKTHDEVVHIPMSSGLSGSLQSAVILSEKYGGKVEVADNVRISVTLRQSVLDALALAESGKNAAQIKAYLEEDKLNASIYICVNTLDYLKKGGRITPAAALLGTALRIKPVLQIQGEKLDAFAKARTLSHAKTVMVSAIKSDMAARFPDLAIEDFHFYIAHSHSEDEAKIFQKELADVFPGQPVFIDRLSLSVACHIGPGALAFVFVRKMR